MSITSRVLGPIELDGGIGGGAMDSAMPIGGATVPVRLEIDYPTDLTQESIDQLDRALESIARADVLARDALAGQVDRAGSAPAALYRAWSGTAAGEGASTAEFLANLRVAKLTLTPDGGRGNRDRVVLAYGIPDSPITGHLTVRLPAAPTGPEVDPAPRAGF